MYAQIFNFVKDQWIWLILFSILLFIGLGNTSERGKLIAKIRKLLNNTILFRFEDNLDQSNSVSISKPELQKITEHLFAAIIVPLEEIAQNLKLWIENKRRTINTDSNKPWKEYGYFIQLIVFLLFLYADAIAVAVTLQAIGLLENAIPGLNNFELSVTIGSLGSVIIGGFIGHEVFGKGEFSDWGDQQGFWKIFGIITTLILLISGMAVVVGLGLARFRVLMELTPDWDFYVLWFTNFVISILVPVNATLAALLVHRDGLKGIQLLSLGIIWVIFGSYKFLLYFANILKSFGIIGLDFVFRIIAIFLYLIVFTIITPLDMLTSRFEKAEN